jgi:hypothetical protein
MPDAGLPTALVDVVVVNLLVDRLTADVAGRFAAAGIDCMLVKGPVIGAWLYEEAIRPYGDSDLLVAASDWDRATALLIAQGFRSDQYAEIGHPRMASSASAAFVRGGIDNLDLHRTLEGLEAAPGEVWEALWSAAGRQEVGGRSIAVPAHPAVLMHLALHAVHHHARVKPIEDLRRGIRVGSEEDWRQAAALAEKLQGLPAFATGLRRLPEGEKLAMELGVGEAGSVLFELLTERVPTAEALHELLGPGLTLGERASRVLTELFPRPSFMRWWTPLARRGKRGLVAAYPLRWGWLAVKVPAGLLALHRARRSRRRDA